MAKKGGRGFKTPKDYDPRRGQPKKFGKAQVKPRVKPHFKDTGEAQVQAAVKQTNKASRKPANQNAGQDRGVGVGVGLGVGHDDGTLIVTDVADTLGKSFKDLGVGDNISRALEGLGAKEPFAIQAVTVPEIIAGKHLLGRAKTGSGKTIAFAVGVVERLLALKKQPAAKSAKDANSAKDAKAARAQLTRGVSSRKTVAPTRNPRALILAPTRELALQIDETVQHISRSVGLFTAQLVGGVPKAAQQHALRRGIDIVIGTPGRVEDLMNRGQLNLREVEIVVLDEADHMSEMGFIEPVTRIMKSLSRGVQTLLFSATLDGQVRRVVREFMPGYVSHEISGDLKGAKHVKHAAFLVFYEEKLEVLAELLQGEKRALVFVRTKAYAEMLSVEFAKRGLRVTSLHGDLSQERRLINLQKFSSGAAHILVATDVAARGIHIDAVDLVLQADPPDDTKTYLHRAGRTGRAGATGVVVTIVPRTRQKRTRELFESAQIDPNYFGEARAGQSKKLLKDLKRSS